MPFERKGALSRRKRVRVALGQRKDAGWPPTQYTGHMRFHGEDDAAASVLADIFGRVIAPEEWEALRERLRGHMEAASEVPITDEAVEAVFSDYREAAGVDKLLRQTPLDEVDDRIIERGMQPFMAEEPFVCTARDRNQRAPHAVKLTRRGFSAAHAALRANMYLEQLNHASSGGFAWELDGRPERKLEEETEDLFA